MLRQHTQKGRRPRGRKDFGRRQRCCLEGSPPSGSSSSGPAVLVLQPVLRARPPSTVPWVSHSSHTKHKLLLGPRAVPSSLRAAARLRGDAGSPPHVWELAHWALLSLELEFHTRNCHLLRNTDCVYAVLLGVPGNANIRPVFLSQASDKRSHTTTYTAIRQWTGL